MVPVLRLKRYFVMVKAIIRSVMFHYSKWIVYKKRVFFWGGVGKAGGRSVYMGVRITRNAEMNSSASKCQRALWINVLAPVERPVSSDTWHWFVHLWTEVLRIKRRENGNASFSLPKDVLKLGKEEGMLTNQALARKSVMNQQWLGKPLSLSTLYN